MRVHFPNFQGNHPKVNPFFVWEDGLADKKKGIVVTKRLESGCFDLETLAETGAEFSKYSSNSVDIEEGESSSRFGTGSPSLVFYGLREMTEAEKTEFDTIYAEARKMQRKLRALKTDPTVKALEEEIARREKELAELKQKKTSVLE